MPRPNDWPVGLTLVGRPAPNAWSAGFIVPGLSWSGWSGMVSHTAYHGILGDVEGRGDWDGARSEDPSKIRLDTRFFGEEYERK